MPEDLQHVRNLVLQREQALDWEKLCKKALTERVLSVVITRLALLQQGRPFAVPSEAIESLWMNGVLDRLLPLYQETSNLLDSLSRLSQTLEQYHSRISQALADGRVGGHCTERIPILLIKGAAVSRLYPDGFIRDQDDIDLVVPTWRGGWATLHCLNACGFTIKTLHLGKIGPRALVGGADCADAAGVQVEARFPKYPNMSSSTIETPLWDRAVEISLAPAVNYLIPSYEDSLLILLAHICKHGSMCWRDINDAYLLIASAPMSLDWDYIAHIARQNALAGLLQAVLQIVEEWYGELPVPQERLPRTTRVAVWLAQMLCLRSREGHMGWSVPYEAGHLFRFKRARFGLILAARDVYSFVLRSLEHQSWFLFLNARRGEAKWYVLQWYRALLLRALLHTRWDVSHLDITRRYLKLRPIRAAANMGAGVYEITAVDVGQCMEVARTLDAFALAVGDVVAWRFGKDEPELVITPVGIYHLGRYTGGPAGNIAYIERQASELVTVLIARTAITARVESNACTGGQ
ncbi:MAG: nucleotidyltransferase family protein [Dehalococcoidia bacterium]